MEKKLLLWKDHNMKDMSWYEVLHISNMNTGFIEDDYQSRASKELEQKYLIYLDEIEYQSNFVIIKYQNEVRFLPMKDIYDMKIIAAEVPNEAKCQNSID